MTLITETVTINSKNYKHIYSDAGYYVKRNDNKLFMDVLEPTSSTYTYTETTQLATQQLLSRMMARMSTLETKHNNLEGLPHVVETYSNGTDWYRVYSDGWCIQQGKYTPTSNPSYITFPKEFKDTNYILSLNVCDTSPTDCALTVASWNALTTKTAQIYQGYNGSTQKMPLMWIAVGLVS